MAQVFGPPQNHRTRLRRWRSHRPKDPGRPLDMRMSNIRRTDVWLPPGPFVKHV